MLHAACPTLDASRLKGWHCYRAMVACAMKAAGFSDAEIQAWLRWKTKESVELYAQPDVYHMQLWASRFQQQDIGASRMQALQAQLPIYGLDDAAEVALHGLPTLTELAADGDGGDERMSSSSDEDDARNYNLARRMSQRRDAPRPSRRAA